MKKKFLLKTMLLLCALVVGSSSVWADTSTLTPTSSTIAPSDDHFTVTYGGSGSATTWNSGGYVRLYAKNTITIASKNEEKITQITFTGTVNANSKGKYPDSMSASVGTITPSTISATGETDFSWTYATGATSVTITLGGTAGNIDLTGGEYVVTYTAAEKTDPTITFNDGSVRVGKTLDLSTLFDSNSTGDVTYSITAGGSYASLDGSVLTGVAEGSVTVHASQAAAGIYNAGTADATITVNAALTLSSIAITTPPTTLIYTEGEIFDATGMVVTATYSDSSIDDVTASCTWSPDGALATTDDEITVSYTENGVTKTATQAITVNAYVQPTDVDIDLNNTFFGTSYGGSLSTDQKSALKAGTGYVEGTTSRINVKFYINESSNFYISNEQIRTYDKTSIKVTAPSGYVLTSVSFVEPGSGTAWAGTHTSTPTGYNATSKAWTGVSSSVEVTFGGTCRIVGLNVTLVEAKSITITAATWASFSSASALDFTDTGVTAYIAKAKDASTVTLTEITKVPANTGIVVNAAAAGTYPIPVLSGEADATTGNLLQPWLTAGEPTETTYYTLAVDGSNNPKFKLSSGGTLAAGKAYLVLGSGARELGVDFGETTGIDSVTRETLTNGKMYNLQGQEVRNAKGIVIVNGKKVIIK